MKKNTIRTSALIFVLSLSLVQLDGGWLWSPASANGASSASQPGVRILDSDETGITLELYTPDFQVEPVATEEITCDQLRVTDYATNDQAGWPALPVRGAMLGIPPDADVTLTVLSTEAEILPDRYALCPVPTPIAETAPTGEISFGGYQLIRDPQAYSSNIFTPASSAELVETGFIRSQRVAQIRFHPFQYNPDSGEVRHLERIQVRLDFNRDFFPDGAAFGAIDEGAFEETLRNTLLNYDAARRWRTRAAPLDSQDQIDWPLPAQTEPSYKVMVDEDGIYEVSYADLQAAGIATATLDSLDPRTFQMHSQGQEVAIYVKGEGDGSFDQEDYIIFYGQKVNTKYTDTNVYWLTWGDENGLRMPIVDGTPTGPAATPSYFLTTQHMEEDKNYRSHYPSGPDNDHWFWTTPSAYGTPTSAYHNFTATHLATQPLSATVRGLFRGFYAAPEHQTQVHLNGHLIDDATWPPATEYAFEVNVPQSYLVDGINTISVTCGISNTYDAVFINWFEIDYYATYTTSENTRLFEGDQAGTWEYQVTGFTTDTLDLFDTTLPVTPTRIMSTTIQPGAGVYTLTFQHAVAEEHHYLALAPTERRSPLQIELDSASDLHATTNGADYIVITHGDFYTSVLPLANHRASQGLRIQVVDVQNVYDEFSYGVFDATAIHDFLAYAYANWESPAPTYVLLVGGGHLDFKDAIGIGEPNYIPPYLADVDPWVGETAADNRYVCINGEDILPDMHLGRLPVRTSAETSAVVTKVIAYEQNPPDPYTDTWNKQLLFVADDPDSAGDFYALSNNVADHYVLAPYTAQKVYYGDTHPDAGEARAAIIDAINDGRLLVNYIGHGSYTYWANGWENGIDKRLFSTDYIPALTNTNRLPLFVPMTCMEGYYILPSLSSLGESVVRAEGKGAIASWSPTGFGVAVGHDSLNQGLFEALFSDNVARLGPATTQSKLYLYSNTGFYRDLIDTYILFGDPATVLSVVQYKRYFPIVTKSGDWLTVDLPKTTDQPATGKRIDRNYP